MKYYRLTVYTTKVNTLGHPFFNENHLTFEKASTKEAIEHAKLLIAPIKKDALKAINNMFRAKKITKEVRDAMIKKYPSKTEMVESDVLSVPIE